MMQAPPALQLPPIIAVPGPLQIKQVPAALSNYSRVVRVPTTIVLHCTDGCEGTTKDRDAALEISKPLPKGHERSFHYVIDADSCTQCVADEHIAYHARHTANQIAIGVEMCGRANQTIAEWFDTVSLATMNITARLCAELCTKWKLPPVLVTDNGLRAGEPGITSHHYVSLAWKQSTHYDPGPNFPLEEFVAAVAQAMR